MIQLGYTGNPELINYTRVPLDISLIIKNMTMCEKDTKFLGRYQSVQLYFRELQKMLYQYMSSADAEQNICKREVGGL